MDINKDELAKLAKTVDEFESREKLPIVKLVGENGNAWMIMGLCQRAARKAGWSKERIESVMGKMRSGDYDNLLRVAMEHFDVR